MTSLEEVAAETTSAPATETTVADPVADPAPVEETPNGTKIMTGGVIVGIIAVAGGAWLYSKRAGSENEGGDYLKA